MCTSFVIHKTKTLVGWNLDILDMTHRVRATKEGVYIEILDDKEGWLPLFGANARGDYVMIFQDNVIKEYLKNVYFITGTPCGGKTTISRKLAKRHNLFVYDMDEQFAKHQKISNSAFQPSMSKVFKDADEFFGRTVEEYKKWLIDNTREQLDFVLLDLIRLSQNQIVLCDCHLTVEEADQLTEASRVVYLIKDPSNLVDDYCNRPDHQGFCNFINSTSDTEKAKAVCNATLKSLNEKRCNDIKGSNYFWIERTENSTVDETVRKVEQHFGLVGKDFSMDTLEIGLYERYGYRYLKDIVNYGNGTDRLYVKELKL